MNFNPGGLVDRIDTRDYKWSELGSVMAPYDWSETYDVTLEIATAINQPDFAIHPKDQDGSYSCGGQSWSYYGATLESLATKSYEERSAKFIYAQTYAPGGGSSGRENCNLVVNQGWGLESQTPSYENGMPPGEYFMERGQDITDLARSTAKISRAASYASVDLSIDSLAQACKINHGLIVGLSGSNNTTWLSKKPAPPKNGEYLWYHWLYVGGAGMYEGEKAIRVLNSWGNVAGDHGWQWITESYLRTVLNDPIHGNSTIWGSWTLLYALDQETKKPFTHHFSTPLTFGDRSDEVKILQQALQFIGDFPASVPCTGYYGTITAAAVYKFQLNSGIFPTAREHVGPQTRAALNAIFDR